MKPVGKLSDISKSGHIRITQVDSFAVLRARLSHPLEKAIIADIVPALVNDLSGAVNVVKVGTAVMP